MITRDSGTDALVPEPLADQIIKELPAKSAMLNLARKVTMPTKTNRIPVMSVLPDAYWVNGDTGLKNTSKADWENVTLVAEEIAVIVPFPDAYEDDVTVNLTAEIVPAVVEAFGAKIDSTCLFGIDKPASWNAHPGIVPGAVAAGNIVELGTGADIGVDITKMGERLAEQGQRLTGFISKPGFEWTLAGARDSGGRAIYGPGDISQGRPSSLYNKPLAEVVNGSWDAQEALLVGGDMNKAIVGIRQDITWKVFDQGVISDSNGVILLNLMQQDSKAIRFVMRIGYALANPVNRVQRTKASRFPFAVLQPA